MLPLPLLCTPHSLLSLYDPGWNLDIQRWCQPDGVITQVLQRRVVWQQNLDRDIHSGKFMCNTTTTPRMSEKVAPLEQA